MTVGPPASHIKELVDPDANIIWGSAFNNELEGKIRVSVVATGIDADAVVQAPPQPAKVFAFPGAARTPAPEPKITLTPPERAAGAAEEPMPAAELGLEASASEAEELTLDTPAAEEAGDE